MIWKTILVGAVAMCVFQAQAQRREFPLPCERYVSPAMAEEYRDRVMAECAAEKALPPEPATPPPAKRVFPAPSLAEAKRLADSGKENLKRRLKDPESVRFRSLFLSAIEVEGTGQKLISYMLCGEVNAKNAMGGYVGFRRFAAWTSIPGAQIDEPENESGAAAFQEVIWSRQCGASVRDVK